MFILIVGSRQQWFSNFLFKLNNVEIHRNNLSWQKNNDIFHIFDRIKLLRVPL